MQSINPPTFEYLTENVFKVFVTFNEDSVELLNCVPKEIAMFFREIMDSDIRISYVMPERTCECGGKLNINSYQDWGIDKKYNIKKCRYECNKCGKTVNTPLDFIVDKGCSYSNDIKNFVADLYSNGHMSYEKVRNIINNTKDLNISRQTVYLYNKEYTDKKMELKEEIIRCKSIVDNITPTGYPGHDEAFLRINGIKYAYFAMLDSNNAMIMNDQLCPETEYRELLEPFIIYSQKDLSVYNDPTRPNPPHHLLLPDFPRNTLIGDGLKEYPKIAKKCNMNFHSCGFHAIMNQRQGSWKEQRRMKRKIISNNIKIEKNMKIIEKYNNEYKGKYGRISENDKKRRRKYNNKKEKETKNQELNTNNSNLNKKIKEYEDLDRRISEIFIQNTLKDAYRRMNILNQMKFLPKPHATFINRISKNPDSFLSHIENPLIPMTNNLLELYFNIVFPKEYRNSFKTIEGVQRFLRAGKIRWYENIVFNEKIKIERSDAWSNLRNVVQNMRNIAHS